ncbi:MAG: hypothetical protein M3P22_02650 [bacterium]|nr:hypothetical protein [bacterium]
MKNESIVAFILEDKYRFVPYSPKILDLVNKYRKEYPIVSMRVLKKHKKDIQIRLGGFPFILLGRGKIEANGITWIVYHTAQAPA